MLAPPRIGFWSWIQLHQFTNGPDLQFCRGAPDNSQKAGVPMDGTIASDTDQRSRQTKFVQTTADQLRFSSQTHRLNQPPIALLPCSHVLWANFFLSLGFFPSARSNNLFASVTGSGDFSTFTEKTINPVIPASIRLATFHSFGGRNEKIDL